MAGPRVCATQAYQITQPNSNPGRSGQILFKLTGLCALSSSNFAISKTKSFKNFLTQSTKRVKTLVRRILYFKLARKFWIKTNAISFSSTLRRMQTNKKF